jgi:hypothetical protein
MLTMVFIMALSGLAGCVALIAAFENAAALGTREACLCGTRTMAASAREQSVEELRNRSNDLSPERRIHLLI